TTTADKGTYLFVKATDGKKQRVHFYFFTNRQQYLGSMLLSDRVEKTASLNRYCRMDSRQNIAFITEKKMPTGEFWTGETIYYMNSEGQMVLAVTNTNEDLSDEIRGNPVDTLPRTHRHSGDYSTDRKNLVSVRDGIRPNTFRFFIHFSKQQGDCIGEVKGEGEWTGPHTGIFRDNNSPCVLEFRFTSASVSIRETDGCGSYRGITCFFEGTYPLKKTPLQKKKK
ncbi:MAG TPA: hypothetical protein PKE63_03685, partial [Lacibacter sp.]|nr:hypothetical protein [Lacibacter sp.]